MNKPSDHLRCVFVSLILVAATTVSIFSGCDAWGPELVVELELPATPESWAAAWGNPDYRVIVTKGPWSVEEYHLPARNRRIGMTLPKEGLVSIVAYPQWDDGPGVAPGETMSPAGAVWPNAALALDDAGPSVTLSYKMGFVAVVLARALTLSAVAGEFNVSRFVAEVDDRLGLDPWCANVDSVVAAISSGNMRADYIRSEPTESFDIELPAGLWHHPSPFRGPVTGGAVTVDLRNGTSVMYAESGLRALFQVDEDGRCWMNVRGPFQAEATSPQN